PTEFLTFWSQTRGNFWRCIRDTPHEVAKQNVIAGFAWALALVNIRHPAIVTAFLNLVGSNLEIQDAIVNGFSSALLVWRDSQPGEQYLRDFVEYQPGTSAGRVSQLWKTYVQEPWSYVAQKQMKPNSMGKIFHYQPLSEIMALVQDRRSSAGQPGGTHQTTGPSLRGEGVTGMQDFMELFMIRPISALL